MVDQAYYKGTAEKSILEIYIAFYQKYLTFVNQEDKFAAEYSIIVQIKQDDKVIDEQQSLMRSEVDSLSEIHPDRQLVNIFGFKLPAADYQVKTILRDANSAIQGEYLFKTTAKSFTVDSLEMSDIELASSISRASGEGEFIKNGLQVIPNPRNIYSAILPMIYYYSEIYNLDFKSSSSGEYVVKSNITDVDGNMVKAFPDKTQPKPGTSAVLVGGHNIVTLPPNIYYLNLEITDIQSQQIVFKSKRFTFQKPEIEKLASSSSPTETTKPTINVTEYSQYSEEELNQEFDYAIYLADKNEQNIFKTLNAEGKRTFLVNFWNRRKPTEREPDLPFKETYFQRVSLVNQYFSTGKIKGWKTDRGRILLVYGNPDQMDRHYMDVNTKPYEIWHFNNLEGGCIFVFADLSGFGDFELLHSSYSKELYNSDWQRLIHRAEGSMIDNFDLR
jgi:GWxTD domain-containing protein